MVEPRDKKLELPRREFMRRSGMVAVALSAVTGTYGLGLLRAGASLGSAIPILEVPGSVTGVTAWQDDEGLGGLVAVGGSFTEGIAEPMVWRLTFGDSDWKQEAVGSDFPSGTFLAGAATVAATTVAVGHVRTLARTFEIIDDETGVLYQVEVFGTTPAIFLGNAGSWKPVPVEIKGVEQGGLTAVTSVEDGSLLAVGSRFPEPGITEGFDIVGLASKDGSAWEAHDLGGIKPPQHGSVTVLAKTADFILVGVRDAYSSGLYVSSSQGWVSIVPPSDNVTFEAAASSSGGIVVAGIDDSAVAHLWVGFPGPWAELTTLIGVPADGRISDLIQVGDGLFAAGSDEDGGFVVAVEE